VGLPIVHAFNLHPSIYLTLKPFRRKRKKQKYSTLKIGVTIIFLGATGM
jgi:hypothetical protein